ncbi:alpha/beta hydrolase [Streptomyces sp. WMMC940]|uniref:alpha/beta hydrolase n=1 Tax=Streptomyces sp. WMMC940 TaxID=3015153 RepID=UPI0022B5E6D8|nr:alpha/beta hydrolase [Streptomyces sp. WMMC940]MCZ7457342.1 alpha/beta hydrolase [Streptomyces sp. WMMC940]
MSTLDPQAQALLDTAAASGLPPVYTLPHQEARKRMRTAFIQGDSEPIETVRDVCVPAGHGDIPARLYHPSKGDELPLVLFFHGGGWTVNDLDTHDRLCTLLANGSRSAFLSVDYRRAPENKYPAALDDAWRVLEWVVDNPGRLQADATRIAVAGDSSGGTIAAALALLARDRGGPRLVQQVLIYPVTDYLDPPTGSYVEHANGYSLNLPFMEWSWRNYLPESWSRDDGYLFPLRARNLGGLPPALVVTAEFDPLKDEGTAYARRLRTAGVPTEHWHFEDQMHGFVMQTRTITRARTAVHDVARHIAAAFGHGKGV